jgi:5-(carboxyamino)imidazole ribonucleotide mutase
VATVALNGAQNAAILTLQILALSDAQLMEKMIAYKAELKTKIIQANEELGKVKYEYKIE